MYKYGASLTDNLHSETGYAYIWSCGSIDRRWFNTPEEAEAALNKYFGLVEYHGHTSEVLPADFTLVTYPADLVTSKGAPSIINLIDVVEFVELTNVERETETIDTVLRERGANDE